MCTQPILIKNTKYRPLRVRTTSSHIEVPCGYCYECQSRKVKDLYVRTRMVHEKVLKLGGSAFMCCLTYDNTQVPRFSAFDGRSFMVFNKKHIIDYIKRLRINLDRTYQRYYHMDAPDFQYMISSEYGSDPTRTRRPHYHLLFFFNEPIGFSTFRAAFLKSFKVNGLPIFGEHYQCEPLDPKRGGSRYCAKYILKDVTYKPANDAIKDCMSFEMDKIMSEFGIIPRPATEEDYFHNTCIRRSKEYKKAVTSRVLPYRHMLQFYMVSNDFGISALLDKYGKSLIHMPTINLDGYVYALPTSVRNGFERKFGTPAKDALVKSSFENFFRNVCADDAVIKKFGFAELQKLRDFVCLCIQPRFGGLYLIPCNDLTFESAYSDILAELTLLHDSDLYRYRERVLRVLSFYNSPDRLKHRAFLAFERAKNQAREYERKKRNKPSNY